MWYIMPRLSQEERSLSVFDVEHRTVRELTPDQEGTLTMAKTVLLSCFCHLVASSLPFLGETWISRGSVRHCKYVRTAAAGGPSQHIFGVQAAFLCHHPPLPGRGSSCQQCGRCGSLGSCGYKTETSVIRSFPVAVAAQLWPPCRHGSLPSPDLGKDDEDVPAFLQIPLSSGKSQRPASQECWKDRRAPFPR